MFWGCKGRKPSRKSRFSQKNEFYRSFCLTERRFDGIFGMTLEEVQRGGALSVCPHPLPELSCGFYCTDVRCGEGKMKRNTTVLVIAAAMCCMAATVEAEVYFENEAYPGGHFTDALDVYNGDNYWYVDADETSVVDVFGGAVDELVPFGSSTANISGGLTKAVEALDASTINITGGEVWDLSAFGQSEISITGGKVEWLYLSSGSQALVLEGDVTNLWAESFSTVDIYGYDLTFDSQYQYDRTRQTWEGQLTGFWQNRTPFSMTTYDEETSNHLILHDLGPLPSVPEPGTLLLLGLGAVLLRRSR